MDNAEILYRSASQTDAQPTAPAMAKYLLPPESPVQLAAESFDVEFACILDNVFPPAQKNTPASAAIFNSAANTRARNSNAVLTGYTQPKDMGAGIGSWTGTFCIVPASWDDIKTLPWTPPGWVGVIGNPNSRNVEPKNVNVRLHYDYFLVDPLNLAGPISDSGNPDKNIAPVLVTKVNAISAIPIIQRNYFFNTFAGVPQFNSFTNSLVPAAGVSSGDLFYLPTFPTIELYQQWMALAKPYLTNGLWDQTHPPVWDGVTNGANFGQLVAEDSIIQPYAGNIIARITRYVLVI